MMKEIKKKILSVLIILFLFSLTGFAQQQKLAQTGMKFLNMSVDARVSAFGDAVTSLENNSVSMFYNPASMARLEHLRSEEHTSELQSRPHLVCRLLLEKKKKILIHIKT